MRQCPWCGHNNLNVYAYCMNCGRGFDPPENANGEKPDESKRSIFRWPFGSKPKAEAKG